MELTVSPRMSLEPYKRTFIDLTHSCNQRIYVTLSIVLKLTTMSRTVGGAKQKLHSTLWFGTSQKCNNKVDLSQVVRVR